MRKAAKMKLLMFGVFAGILVVNPVKAKADFENSYSIGEGVYCTDKTYLSGNKIEATLSWEKEADGDGVEIYRVNNGKKTKLADVSDKKRAYTVSFTSKKGQKYILKRYVIKKGKKKYTKQIDAYISAKPTKAEFNIDRTVDMRMETSGKKVTLFLYNPEGECTSNRVGYDIYRKTTGKYKKIGTVKPKKRYNSIKYVDKKVKTGKKYSYKVKTYIMINGKKKYTSFSKKHDIYACNNKGKYKVECLTKPGKTESIEVKVTGIDKGNAKATIEPGDGYVQGSIIFDNGEEITNFKLTRYSYDGKNWKDCDSFTIIKMNPLSSIYLSFVPCDSSDKAIGAFDFDQNKISHAVVSVYTIYNFMGYNMDLDLKNNKVIHEIDEYYDD